MLKIKKSELDKIKFSGISQLMNIQGVKMSDENDPIKEKDFLMLMAQTPHLNVTYGNCTGNPCMYISCVVTMATAWGILVCIHHSCI